MAGGNNIHDVFYHQDIASNKVVAGFAYLVFFLPLIMCPGSAFGRFHANQSLVLLLFSAANVALRLFLIFAPAFGNVLFCLLCIPLMIFALTGMLNAFRGRAKKLPLIGELRLLK